MNEVGGSCFPTTETLAEETGLSERAICTHLELAKKLGWIVKGKHGFKGQGWKRHEYAAQVPPDVLKEVQYVDTEGGSEPSEKALNDVPNGTEPNDKKALNDVQSSSSINSTSNSTGARGTKRPKTPLPENFEISDQVKKWADKNGHQFLEERLDDFTLKAQSKGYVYADWDAAFKIAIREDWAKLNSQRQQETSVLDYAE
jgi:hypothetical protein